AGDQARAARGADRGVREGPGEPRPFAGEPVHVRRDGVRVAVATELRTHVLADDPDDVRPRRVGGPGAGRAGGEPGADEEQERPDERAERAIEHRTGPVRSVDWG